MIIVESRLNLVCIVIRSVSQPTGVLTCVYFWKMFFKITV